MIDPEFTVPASGRAAGEAPPQSLYAALVKPNRRRFLKMLGGGLVICLTPGPGHAQESGRSFAGHELPQDISAWLHIAADGKVQVFTGKVEVGQNIRTSLAQQVAEELRVSFDSVSMVMGDTDLVPWDMGTFGSRTTPTMGPQLRTMAWAARESLLELAARRWNVDAHTLRAADGRVTNPNTAATLSYGELTRGEKLLKTVAQADPLTPAAEWRIAGRPIAKVNGRDFVTGKHKYPSDIVRPEMLHGAILRPDGFSARLVSLDLGATEKLPGVKVVRDGDFVGVVAPDAYGAAQALKSIRATWDVPAQPSNDGLFEYLKAHPDNVGEGGPQRVLGSVSDALTGGDLKLEERYTVQYIAHAPLEPRAAAAEWNDGKLTVWTGTQRPFGVRDELVQALHLRADQVRVIQPDMGSAYGGKHTGEAALEAARLAKAVGKPVKVVWTRDEEFTWGYLRPAGLIEIRAAAQRDGTLIAWEHHNYNSGPSGIATPYKVANQLIQYHPSQSPLRQGSYRGLASTANNFARESHIDGLANAAQMDPLQFRLKNLEDTRLRAALEAAADKFGWGKLKSTPERGFGIACGTEKGGYMATCAEVEINTATKQLRVRRVVEAWESGAVVNPDGLQNQVMGAVVQAIGGALFEQILFANGRILNPRFAHYRLPRFKDTPEVEVVLLDRKDLPPAGAGETGIVGLAPAVGNAIFAATGTRLRSMPMAPRVLATGRVNESFQS
jgi:CO/xanthine dehydrogenase Mo-binding subunit